MLGHHGFPWKLTNYHVLLQVQHHNRKQLPLVSTAVPFPHETVVNKHGPGAHSGRGSCTLEQAEAGAAIPDSSM